MRAAPLVWFFALAFALSWAWWLPIALAGDTVRRGDGWPTQVPGLLGPLLAALLVLAVGEGRSALAAWLRAMVRLPAGARVWLLVLAPLGFLVLGLAVAAVVADLPEPSDFLRMSGTPASAGAFAASLVIGAYGEEAGWRGYALPRLQERLGAVRATWVIAVIGRRGTRRCSPYWPATGASARSPCPASSSGWRQGRSC